MPSSLPQALQEILQKALEKLPARRFAKAPDMAQALQQTMATPELQPWLEHRLPWRDLPIIAMPKLLASDHPVLLAAPVTNLITVQNNLVAASGQQIQIWRQSGPPPVSLELPEPIHAVSAHAQGCLVQTQQRLYWLPVEDWQPQPWLSLEGNFTAAVDPSGQNLAVAVPGCLCFYKVFEKPDRAGRLATLQRTLPFSEKRLPRVFFLNRNHVLLVWHQPEQKHSQTLLKVCTRRGTWIGSLQLPLSLNQLTLIPTCHTLFGVDWGSEPIAWRVGLLPPQVARIPLAGIPLCSMASISRQVLIDAQGHITLLEQEQHQVMQFKGLGTPTAITTWGLNQLAIATDDGKQSYLYFQSAAGVLS
ncbi:MAG: hypothetical protein F6K19_22460 [Cyanothece sp. SIO1E1]|nr:hypothetical protein [Cyanothece sp. SIO1E1]